MGISTWRPGLDKVESGCCSSTREQRASEQLGLNSILLARFRPSVALFWNGMPSSSIEKLSCFRRIVPKLETDTACELGYFLNKLHRSWPVELKF